MTASMELGDPPHHGGVPCLRSVVVPDDVGRDTEQPRKCVVIAGVVTLPCSEGRFEHVGEQVFGRKSGQHGSPGSERPTWRDARRSRRSTQGRRLSRLMRAASVLVLPDAPVPLMRRYCPKRSKSSRSNDLRSGGTAGTSSSSRPLVSIYYPSSSLATWPAGSFGIPAADCPCRGRRPALSARAIVLSGKPVTMIRTASVRYGHEADGDTSTIS